MKRNPEHNFIVLGEDQAVYMQQISAVLDILGYDSPKLVSYSYVLLDGDTREVFSHKEILEMAYLEQPNVTKLCNELGYDEIFLTAEEFINYKENLAIV